MRRRLAGHLTYANVVSSLALFAALGGGAFAAVSLPKHSVGARQLRSGAVTASKLHANAVRSSKVKNQSLRAADFKTGELPAGATGLTGPQGPKGDTGAQGIQGPVGPSTGPAGGSLAGSYPNPTIAPDAITSPEVKAGSLRLSDLAVGSTRLSFNPGTTIAAQSCFLVATASGGFLAGDDAHPVAQNVPTGLLVAAKGVGSDGIAKFDVCNVTNAPIADLGLVVDVYVMRP